MNRVDRLKLLRVFILILSLLTMTMAIILILVEANLNIRSVYTEVFGAIHSLRSGWFAFAISIFITITVALHLIFIVIDYVISKSEGVEDNKE